jgi:hypothetical protein
VVKVVRKKLALSTSEIIADLEMQEKTSEEIAEHLGVSIQQLDSFVKDNRVDIDYYKSRLLGRRDEWLRALSKKAVGYEYKERKVTTTEANGKKRVYTEVTEKHLPPDTQALLWLIEHTK